MSRIPAVFAALLAALTLVATSCDNTPEQQRSVVSVTSINQNVSPLLSDVQFNDGTGTSYVPDYVEVVMYNRPYNVMIFTSPEQPFGAFQVTRYKVEWTRTDGGSPALPTYENDMTLVVDSEDIAGGNILLVTVDNKTNPPLSDLAGSSNTITMNAKITFYGHEVGTERETEVVANLGVLFGDVINSTGP